MAPSRAYLELEDHPAIKVPYTFSEETARKNKEEYIIKIIGEVEL